MEHTVCELFAGVGGFRVGLERSTKDKDKWKTVWFNQWEPSRKSQWAYDCYYENFYEKKGEEPNEMIKKWANTDIALIPKDEIPDHTLLVGGFPCQDYSVARTQAEGIKGKKGVLWWQIRDVLEEKEPPFVLLENVDRLIKSRDGADFGVMLACLNNLGYTVEWRVINAADYGFPQRRRRVFIFASKIDNNYSKNIVDKDIEEVLYERGFFASVFPVESGKIKEIHTTELSEDIVKVSDMFSFEFQYCGIMKKGKIYTGDVNPVPLKSYDKKLLRDIVEEGEVPKEYFLNDEELSDWKYMKGAKAEERVAKNGHKYTFREGAIAFPDPLDRPSRTMLTSERSKNRSTHVIKDVKTGKLRKLTARECERLNGFPDDWTDTETMSHSFRYFCMGNALVVGLIEKMGKRLDEIVEDEKSVVLT